MMRFLRGELFEAPMADLNLLLDYLRNEDESDRLASVQLHRELRQHANLECRGILHQGVKDCPLYTRLPTEIRHQIFSYIVCVPESIHVYPVKGNSRLGYRLSRCADTLFNINSGTCSCESSFPPPPTPPAYLDTELLLVSKTVRRETLDLMFLHNSFTFTSIRDLANFTESFTACAAKMQNMRLYQRVSDHNLFQPGSNATKAWARIGNLHNLELNCYLDDFSYYETRFHDGFITEILPLAFPRPENVKVTVRASRLWGSRSEEKDLLESVEIVKKKLDDVFSRRWATLKEVPISTPPKKRVPECEKEPSVKRGILALCD